MSAPTASVRKCRECEVRPAILIDNGPARYDDYGTTEMCEVCAAGLFGRERGEAQAIAWALKHALDQLRQTGANDDDVRATVEYALVNSEPDEPPFGAVLERRQAREDAYAEWRKGPKLEDCPWPQLPPKRFVPLTDVDAQVEAVAA